MTEYTSKQVKIEREDSIIYEALSNFDNFTPLLKDKVEQWSATKDSCSFKVKGFTMRLEMVEKIPNSTIKITGIETPFEFNFWIQLKKEDENDTRMRLVAKIKLNTMMKMMIGNKFQKGIDNLAEQIAIGLNTR